MKRLCIIIAVLCLSAATLSAQENSGTDSKSRAIQSVGIIKEIHEAAIKIGSEEFPVSPDLTGGYAENGERIPLSFFKVEDGVIYKLDKTGKLIYLKKLPR